MKFRTTLLQGGKTATGIVVPGEVVAALGAGKRPPVKMTINGHSWRNTVAVMGGRYMLGVSAENRAAAGVAGGDEVEVELELDSAPREVEPPADFAAALKAAPAAAQAFAALSNSRKKWWLGPVEAAKTAETRQRCIARAVERLAAGQT